MNTFDFPSDIFETEDSVIEYVVESICNDIDYVWDATDSNHNPILSEDDPELAWLKSKWSAEEWRTIVLGIWGEEINKYWHSIQDDE